MKSFKTLATAVGLALAVSAGATPLLPTAVFDPSATGWISLRNLTSSQFAARFDELKRTMMVVDLEVDVIGGDYRVGAVFQTNPDGRGWASLRDLTSSEFNERWEGYRAQGFRLVDQETYVRNGQRLYAGVWIENREGLDWASYRGVTSAQFSQKFVEYRDRGFLPVDIEVYRVGNGWRYGLVWVENVEHLAWKLRRGLTSAQYGNAFAAYKARGLRSIDVEPVQASEDERYAGIWVENASHRGWYAYRDLTATQYRNRWNRLSDMGYRLDGFEKYATSSGVRYAGIWRQNSSRPNWELRPEVDALVQNELDTYDVPGIGVAVAYNGELVYLRGFGYQDIDDGVWMHGRSVNRIASVSKAMAGLLGMRMVAKHPDLHLDEPVRNYLPRLPDHHSYTVGQTLMNRSCIAHYPDGFSSVGSDHYDTAWEAVQDFMDQPLSCTPGSYLYSTAAYTMFGAVLEPLEGKPINQIFLDEITFPFGLTTLRPEDRSVAVPDRVTLYNSRNEEYDGDDVSWKTLGGGLESSALDVTRAGMMILDGTILTPAQRTTMWTPIGDYAYGWDISTVPGEEFLVGKAGEQPGANAYLRMYPDDGIVISVLTNRRSGGHSARLLSRAIGELMLAELP